MTDLELALLSHPLAVEHPGLHAALDAAFQAANILRESRLHAEFGIDEKSGDRGLVTLFDRESEQIIRELLLSRTGYSLLGEEEGLSGLSSEMLWIVDPIDGTTNFSRGIPLAAIAIALAEHGRLLLGVVYNPFLDECFFAVRGSGAYQNGIPIMVSPQPPKGKPVVFVNSGYAPEFESCARNLTEELRGSVAHRHFGTTALEICYVAAGRADAFASIGDELWDYAAAVVIAREAGAMIIDWEGADWSIQRSDLVVTAPWLWTALEEPVRNVFPAGRTV